MKNKILAEKYAILLNSIDFNDEILCKGLQEGLNKFLSNAYLHMAGNKNKYYKSHYVSKFAIEKIKDKDFKSLVFEHVVPKSIYIQKPCEDAARNNIITAEFIENILNKYWVIATITKEEDKKLLMCSMPNDWDGCDIFARYKAAGIELIANPYRAL